MIKNGYTPCEWKYDDSKESESAYCVETSDETLTSFLFILRTAPKFPFEARLFKLKEKKRGGDNNCAVSHRNNTAFDFGCNDFFFYKRKIHSYLNGCCYEWYDTKNNSIRLCGNTGYKTTPKEIEIYQLY